MKNRRAFTLMELLIIIAIIALVAVAVMIILNPWLQIAKARDSKRKSDISTFSKASEEWYNDRGCYPKPSEVCYPSAQTGFNPAIDTKCYFCGTNPQSPSFSAYMTKLPCDPLSPAKNYLYQVDNNSCPGSYKVYASLDNLHDEDAVKIGCALNGCGPTPAYGFALSSPNTSPQYNGNYWCFATNGWCRNCTTYKNCLTAPTCTSSIYADFAQCCAGRLPKPFPCP